MRAPVTRTWKEKLPGIVAALAVQAFILAALVYSLVVPSAPPVEMQETILLLPPLPAPPSRAPVVIDARPKPAPEVPQPAVTSTLPPGSGGITVSPARPGTAPPPPSAPETTQQQARPRNCTPYERLRTPARCPTEVKPENPNALVLNPPTGVKDPERWAKEKARADAPTDLGIAVGPGIGIVIQEPMCKLAWVLLGGGFQCNGPSPGSAVYSDAQVKSAMEAYHKRRGGGRVVAVPSSAAMENGNEKDRDGGNGAGPVPEPGTGTER